MNIKQLHRTTGSLVDWTIELSKQNVEAITLRILEDMMDVVLEAGFDTIEQAYDYIRQTSDIIDFIMDHEFYMADLSPEHHAELILEHLCLKMDGAGS